MGSREKRLKRKEWRSKATDMAAQHGEWLNERSDILAENIDNVMLNMTAEEANAGGVLNKWTKSYFHMVPQSEKTIFDKLTSPSIVNTSTQNYNVEEETRRQQSRIEGLSDRVVFYPKIAPLGWPINPENILGRFDPVSDKAYINMNSISGENEENETLAHELAHGIGAVPQEYKIQSILNETHLKDRIDRHMTDKIRIIDDLYLDTPKEIFARLTAWRLTNNIDPNKVFTLDDIKEIKRNINETTKSSSSLRRKQKDEYMYKSENEIFSRYKDEFLLRILNEVAMDDSIYNKSTEPSSYRDSFGLNLT